MEQLSQKAIERNRRFQAKISWKRKEALEMRNQIREFIEDRYRVCLPVAREAFEETVRRNPNNESFTLLKEQCEHLVRLYYTLGECGISVGYLFEREGELETFTAAHFYSKHKLDPVWNMRKSQLIRSIYSRYLDESGILEKALHPVHITLTVPHRDGFFEGKRFYARELMTRFNEMRKLDFWKKSVYGGEYGCEIKRAKDVKNGLHIHIHSFALLNKCVKLNEFREKLKQAWERLTDGVSVWCETLYFFCKDEKGNYIKEIKKKQAENGMYETDLQRKKFYLDSEAKRILTSVELDEALPMIKHNYLKGILECVKYHFKMDDLMYPNLACYDIELMNKILVNTHKTRLYSRFGAFYKDKSLNFNQIKDDENQTKEETLAAAQTEIYDPFTGDRIDIDDLPENVKIVIFKPERQNRQFRGSIGEYRLMNAYDKNIYTELDARKTLKQHIKTFFDKRVDTSQYIDNIKFYNRPVAAKLDWKNN